MYFYTEDNKRIRLDTSDVIAAGEHGSIYRLSDDECLKVYKFFNEDINPDVLKLIRELNLRSFYEIYRLLYDKGGNLKGYTMKYYESPDIDILTMPVEYTLNSLFNLYNSVIRLADNNIFASDMHDDNVILGNDGITVIDTDLYYFSHVYRGIILREKNTKVVRKLFENLFFKALNTYHSDIPSYKASQRIQSIFGMTGLATLERTCKKLVKYKYPIDYIRKGR